MLRYGAHETPGAVTLPDRAIRANKALGFDGNGDPVAVSLEGSMAAPDFTVSGTGAATFDGKPLSYAPEFSGTLDVVYEFPLSASLTGRVQSNLKYVGAYYLRPEALPIDREDGYTVVDAQVGVISDSGWDAMLWARNLADEVYLVDGQAGFGSNRYSLGMTRTYGLSVTVNF